MSFCPSCSKCPQCCSRSGCRGQSFWQTWQRLGANPRVVSILKEGYTLPFKIRPPLTQSPVIKSGYAHLLKSKALFTALVELINKLVVEKVVIRSSVAFYNRLFSGTKTQQQMKTYSRSQLSKPVFAIRHLQNGDSRNNQVVSPKGEWVTSLDFSDTYFTFPSITDPGSTSGFF